MNRNFSVVRYSPDPEDVEFINVGLLFRLGRHVNVHYDEHFSKLACVAPQARPSAVRQQLDQLARALERGEPVSSVHFRIEPPRELASDPSDEVIAILKTRFLKKPDRPRHRHADGGVRVSSEIDKFFLDRKLRLRAIKNASPERFLSPSTLNCLEDVSVRVSRVINGTRTLVLLDGVDLSLSNARDRAMRIRYSFFVFSKLREVIVREEKRELYRAAIVFCSKDNPSLSAEFVRDTLGKTVESVEMVDVDDIHVRGTTLLKAVREAGDPLPLAEGA